MTTPYLAADITADEGGVRRRAYGDPLTGGAPWTCGVGCTGPDVGPKTVWTLAYAIQRRDAAIAGAIAALDRGLGWWRGLSDPRQDVLANMTYNLGFGGLMGFHGLLAAAERGDYAAAAAEMLDSKWAAQVHARRAGRLAEQMRAGLRIAPAEWARRHGA